jgi:hypothetical protein
VGDGDASASRGPFHFLGVHSRHLSRLAFEADADEPPSFSRSSRTRGRCYPSAVVSSDLYPPGRRWRSVTEHPGAAASSRDLLLRAHRLCTRSPSSRGRTVRSATQGASAGHGAAHPRRRASPAPARALPTGQASNCQQHSPLNITEPRAGGAGLEHSIKSRQTSPLSPSEPPKRQIKNSADASSARARAPPEGHAFGRKVVAISISAVTGVSQDGIQLDITRQQVKDLPAGWHPSPE